MAKRKVSRPAKSGQTQVTTRNGITGVYDATATSPVDGEPDGTYSLPVDTADLQEEVTIPVVAEELDMHKRKVTTGRVRVVKRVHRRQQVVDEPTITETVEVQRVPVNKVVEQPPEVRQEGDTTVIPVLEERLVVAKQLVLVEEVHLVRRRREHRSPQTVMLRGERVDVEHLDGEA